MKTLPDDIIKAVAKETGDDPAFIEKDWYAVEVLHLIHAFQNRTSLFFSGGTSLSKGHKLIQRFSEDLDFIACFPVGIDVRQKRRDARKALVDYINNDKKFNSKEVISQNQSKFFEISIKYDRKYTSGVLRPDIKLEVTFTEPKLPSIQCDINSIVSDTTNKKAELNLPCISPLEIAGDKVSALAWRIFADERESKNYDKTLLRHLHDLAALENLLMNDKIEFIKVAQQSFLNDKNRSNAKIADIPVNQRLKLETKKLKENKRYEEEYDGFVNSMSYAKSSEKIEFQKALEAFSRITKLFDAP